MAVVMPVFRFNVQVHFRFSFSALMMIENDLKVNDV